MAGTWVVVADSARARDLWPVRVPPGLLFCRSREIGRILHLVLHAGRSCAHDREYYRHEDHTAVADHAIDNTPQFVRRISRA
jgi:hypothetical protein